MKNLNAMLIVALIGLFATGCSKNASKQVKQSKNLPADVKDLGIVELKNNESHKYDLGDGKDCTVTISTTPRPENNLLIDFVIEAKDGDGNLRQIGNPKVSTSPGHAVRVTGDNYGIQLMPKLKTN